MALRKELETNFKNFQYVVSVTSCFHASAQRHFSACFSARKELNESHKCFDYYRVDRQMNSFGTLQLKTVLSNLHAGFMRTIIIARLQ